MGGIGLPELLIVLVIIMIIFGAGKIPGIGSAFGNTIRNFKRSMKETDEPEASVEEISQIKSENADALKAVPETSESSHSENHQDPDDSSASKPEK
ncbi:MAG: hypothetical protein NPINA01_11900 [Nitrospinaceae bacterium]|nr:MAG: hypothetical protein NPINA01_11900 [Nitrospinaceae bacterium]